MSLRIAFDMDGVVADMEAELVRQAEILFGEPMTRRLQREAGKPSPSNESGIAPPAATNSEKSTESTAAGETPTEVDSVPPLIRLQLTERQQRRLWRHVETIENFWETLKEIESGSVSRLAAVATARKWEVIFLTKRPATLGSTSQVQTQRWLESKGFTLPSVYVVQGSRGRIAAALDIDFVVDDRPENCLDVVADSTARAILVWREDERQLPSAARRLGIGVVKSVDECLDILAKVDQPAEKPRIVDRVMQLLGLKETASA